MLSEARFVLSKSKVIEKYSELKKISDVLLKDFDYSVPENTIEYSKKMI